MEDIKKRVFFVLQSQSSISNAYLNTVVVYSEAVMGQVRGHLSD